MGRVSGTVGRGIERMEVLPVSFQGSGTGREKQTCSGPEARRPELQGPRFPIPGCESCGAPPLAICSAATAAEASCLRHVPVPLDAQAFSCIYVPAAAVPPDPL